MLVRFLLFHTFLPVKANEPPVYRKIPLAPKTRRKQKSHRTFTL